MSGTSSTYTYQASLAPNMPAMLILNENTAIPCDLDNMDYQIFLAWIAAGNTPPSGWTGPTNPGVAA